MLAIADRAFALADHVLVRTAGLPLRALEIVEGFASRRCADAVARCNAAQLASAAALCERLHDAIRHERDPARRRELLELKRAVFNGRSDVAAFPALAPGLTADLRAWQETARMTEAAVDAGRVALRNDLAHAVAALQELWRDEGVRNGVLFSQHQLFRELNRALSRPAGEDGFARKGVLALLGYCVRSATKTSPFSSFTVTAVGSLRNPDGDGGRNGDHVSTFALRSDVVARLHAMLAGSRAVGASLPLNLNPTAWEQGEALCALRTDDEAIVSVTRTRLIDRICDIVVACRPARAELVDRLVEQSSHDRRELETFVERLVEANVLVARLEYDPNDHDAIARLAASARAHPACLPVATRLASIAALVTDLGAADTTERSQILDRIDSAVMEVAREAENGPAIAATNLVHHNTFARGAARVPVSALGEVESGLHRLARVLPLFADMRVREHLGTILCARGAPVGLMELCASLWNDAVRADVSDPFELAAPGPDTLAADAARAAFVAALGDAAASDRPVDVPGELLARWGDIAERFAPRGMARSVAFAGHLTEAGGAALFVLNKALPGYGALFASATSDDERQPGRSALTRELRARLAAVAPGAEPVELVGVFGCDAQIRARLTERCLVRPADTHANARAIPWNAIEAVFDETLERPILREIVSQRRIVPLHQGPISPAHFSAFYRLVEAFGPAYVPDFSLVDLLEAGVPPERRGTIRHYARLVHDRVVILRETWCVPHALLPDARRDEEPFAGFMRLRDWARRIGLPRRCFVTPMRVPEYFAAPPSARFARLRKPFFIDWDDPVTQLLFRRYTQATGSAITVTEMLPDGRGDDFVREIMCELYDDA